MPKMRTRWEFRDFFWGGGWGGGGAGGGGGGGLEGEVSGGLGQTTTEQGRPLSSSSLVPTAPNTAHTCWKGQVLIDNRAPAITLLFLSGWKSPVFCVCVCVCVCVQKERVFFFHRE